MEPYQESGITVRKPAWLKRPLPAGRVYGRTKSLVENLALHTVCQEAKCPNRFECFSRNTATFLILGSTCTRHCRFCSIDSGPCLPPDPEEPGRVAMAAASMKLRYVVVTSVTRDDLADGGAGLFAQTIREIRKRVDWAAVEVLVPDFGGEERALATVLDAAPDVLNHNIETVPRLYESVRPQADYRRSLNLLAGARNRNPAIHTKSGIMLGLGETSDEVDRTLRDIHASGCGIITIGQYLQPTKHRLPVQRFVSPEEFEGWRKTALRIGFEKVSSGPFVRSSYRAGEMVRAVRSGSRKETSIPPGTGS